jgi:hypothetical protein
VGRTEIVLLEGLQRVQQIQSTDPLGRPRGRHRERVSESASGGCDNSPPELTNAQVNPLVPLGVVMMWIELAPMRVLLKMLVLDHA